MLLKNIYVHPSTEWLGHGVMEALARLTPVQFKSCPNPGDLRQDDVVLSLSGDDRVLSEISERQFCYFHVANRIIGPRSEDYAEPVRFTNSENLDKVLRGRTIRHQTLSNLPALSVESGDDILAHYGERPIWIVRRGKRMDGHIVSAPLPELTGREKPFDYLNGYHFIQLLPLLHFLRKVTEDLGWERSPLRACLMFDDPNLHWYSYGFLSYRELTRQARKDGFHVTVATVPLDMWGSHSRAVSLFKDNPEYLSLLVHGNNHTRAELGKVRAGDRNLRLIAQSLCRTENFERVTGLHVDRVMIPPQEALAEGALAAMSALGIEGTSLTLWSLRSWNTKREWPPSFGLEMAEMIDADFPVLMRYGIDEAHEGPIVISAFLGSPIVLVAHHTVVASGIEVLSRIASVVNSLGKVRWCGTEGILRSNYMCRRENSTLWVKAYSRRFELCIPQDISSVVLAAPGVTDEVGVGECNWIVKRPDMNTETSHAQNATRVNVVPGERIEVVSSNLGIVNHRQLEMPEFSIWARPRRILCETRDRISVLRPRTRRV